jgi:hypothetical protein
MKVNYSTKHPIFICAKGFNIPLVLLILSVFMPFSCTTKDSGLNDAPIVTSSTYQHTLYNGLPQPIDARAAKDDITPFVITYFNSEEDLEKNRKGTTEAPVEVGKYYVRIDRPAGNGYKKGFYVKVEYMIQKALVVIIADEKQEAVYDGKPKTVIAKTDAPVALDILYYTYENGVKGQTALRNAPVEPGRYRVDIVWPGDKNYLGSSREVEFTIKKK